MHISRRHIQIIIGVSSVLLVAIFLISSSSKSVSIMPGKAELSVVPSMGTYSVDEEFTVDVKLDSAGEAIGGVDVRISHSPNIFLVKTDEAQSVFDQGVLRESSDGDQAIREVRVRFDKGFNGADGKIISLTFKAVAQGESKIDIDVATSEVIAFADSTNILTSTNNGEFMVSSLK